MLYPKITLKAARVSAGLKQKDAAVALGISKSTLINYEHGKTVPDWNMVNKICKLYDIPADFIFFGS